ncbi:hypothetical protein [Sphingosinicella sp. BN140058]|uniref:hypothetical protein n=1 Tax=Sphingosinicella sp. BN140058 TaxID=1892855 RepID=UPI00101173F7|nr:hypothetical protein [Sphingosinicella sp. BN140058]QAY80410.1 hypothetical protein ETR14_27610 [Sphingosinicella sp. BN140058]
MSNLGFLKDEPVFEEPVKVNERISAFAAASKFVGVCGLAFRDAVSEKAFAEEFNNLLSRIDADIADKPLGALIRTNLYVDNSGTPSVPQGSFLSFLGYGSEPLDALSEHLRRPQLDILMPSGMNNVSEYFWLRSSGGQLKMTREADVRGLVAAAKEEAHLRNRLAISAADVGGIEQVERLAYWAKVATDRAEQITDDAERRRLRKLSKDFEVAQREFNQAYRSYIEAARDAERAQRSAAIIGAISLALDAIELGVQAGHLTSAGNVTAQTLATQDSNREVLKIINIRITEAAALANRQRSTLDTTGQSLKQLNDKLSAGWRGLGAGDGTPLQLPPWPEVIIP